MKDTRAIRVTVAVLGALVWVAVWYGVGSILWWYFGGK
jgi:hypothetical protein